MAEISKNGTPSMSTPLPNDANRLPPLPVGEDIAAGDACYVHTDGKIYRSDGNGTTGVVGNSAEIDGWAPMSAKVAQRQTLSLYHDVTFTYGSSLPVGTYLFLSTTVKGGLTDTVGTKQTKPIARVIDGTRIRACRSY